MEKVIFLETDPAFTLAYRGYSELGSAGRLRHLGTQTAGRNPLLSTNGNTHFGVHSSYNFSRRASVAARISMCVATGLPLRNWAQNQLYIVPSVLLQPGGIAFSLGGQLDLDDFVAHFDQMFPHHLIQRMLQNQVFPFIVLTKRILIFVFRLENNIRPVNIIEIITTINIRCMLFGNITCSISTTAMNSMLGEGEDGPWYRHLQSICFQPVQDVHLSCVEEHEQDADDDADEDSDED